MTGKLLLDAVLGPYTRALFELDEGLLVYDDIRHFGKIEWSRELPDRVGALGPDALTVALEEFMAMLRKRRSMIKPLLMNQGFVRGMGNIYTDEALFLARIHPKAIASRLSGQRAGRLHKAMVDILSAAIELKGSSISDYVDSEGRKGSFQLHHQVYGREGEPCAKCGSAIRRIVLGSRGTHYCPRCQRS
jgi:formamidopyrimidine-DNA glycosylase